MKYDGALFVYAAECADQDGLCFVHVADDGPPTHVVMTAERYREITGRIFAGAIPLGDPEWMHDHATPEMLVQKEFHAALDEVATWNRDRKEPPLLKLEDGTTYRVKHMRLFEPLPLEHNFDQPPAPKTSAKGGKTVVEIIADDGETVLVTGVAICRRNENYNRRLGRTIALGRAQKELRALTT